MTAIIRPFGDTAALVEFASDDRATPSAMALNRLLRAEDPQGIVSTTPSYDSVLVTFDPTKTSYSKVHAALVGLLERAHPEPNAGEKLWSIPTCFDPSFALDCDPLQYELSLSWDSLVETFCRSEYRVNAMGFLPGFPYLGGLADTLHCSRMKTPRARVPASSVAIAGDQAGIYPLDSPGGWRILARIPISLFNPERQIPALLAPNDRVSFLPITLDEFTELSHQWDRGDLDIRPWIS
ncbi:MAG: allophanate hydrolase subunit 1 [Luminiphilus sp.]|jgi:KipI family sensor histidine kinase inhibitor|nr:allophanate hydrolase subunit 1 [Luminiphilus sp.]MDG1506885.1 allophanate hydrolase subunit 1 [Luminiphilus sp.]MDG1653890.1 allophanate hydrolase subunit 1 [Luminiphilus sp.]